MSGLVATVVVDVDGREHAVIGLDAPVRQGLAVFHEEIDLDGEVWRKGDVFYLLDHHRTPRDHTFAYWNVERSLAKNGGVTCYSQHRYLRHAAGFHSLLPTRTIVVADTERLKLEQIISDILDLDIPEDEAEAVAARIDKMRRDWPTVAATTRTEILRRAARIRDKYEADPT